MLVNGHMVNKEILETAFKEYGIKEIKGQDHNPRILQYFEEIGKSWVQDDETAWCSAFMNWVALKSNKERSGELTARSWLSCGTAITVPTLGDTVIFWRESHDSWKGHVGIFINKDDEYHYVLGGNQYNMVCIQPYANDRVLGYRRLLDA